MADDSWQVPSGFPYGLSDEALENALQHMTAVPRTSRWETADTALKAALIQVGVSDQLRRQADRSARTSRTIACVSLGIALVAVLISVCFGIATYQGDKDWQQQQAGLLTEIRDRLPNP